VHSSSILKTPRSCDLPSLYLAIQNHQHLSTLATLLLLALSITQSNANVPMQWRCYTSGCWMAKHKNISNFIISPVKKTWTAIYLNTTWLTFINTSDHIMCILTSPVQSSHGPLSLAFGKGVLKSLGTHIARSPHYHVLGPSLICLSPRVSLATKYLASCEYSIEYHFHTVSLEEHQQSSTHISRERL
jgi:hypothetical protein